MKKPGTRPSLTPRLISPHERTSRYNPSRRSRFRAQDGGNPRRPDPVATVPEEPTDQLAAPAQPDLTPPADDEYAAPAAMPEETWPAEAYATDLFVTDESTDGSQPVAQEYETPTAWPVEVPADEPPAIEEARYLPQPSTADEGLAEELPPAFQLRKVYEGTPPRRTGLIVLYIALGSIVMLALGGLGGYFYAARGVASRPVAAPSTAALPGKPVVPLGLTAETQAAVDGAFEATKQRRYQEAEKQFTALHNAHPEWPSMGIESARATLYEFDAQATARILSLLTRNGPLPDAQFMQALLHLTHKEFEQAGQAFASAVALDPARPDFYYFWGECLRSEGKPREAVGKFQAALLRNQYETSEDLYVLKLWLSQIQADQEEMSGTNAKIDAGLAELPRSPYSAVFAAAAREIKAGRFKAAAAYISQAQQITEPVVFRVIVQDPTFLQENWRPELAGFYK